MTEYINALCCLFFFNIRILIAPLVSSNSSLYTIHVHVLKWEIRHVQKSWDFKLQCISPTTISVTSWSIEFSAHTFHVDSFFLLSLPRLLPDLTVYMSNTVGVLYEAGTAYLLLFLWGSCLIYAICVRLRIVISSTCYVVFLLCLITLFWRIYVYKHVKNTCFNRAKNINNLLSFDV